MDKRAIIISGFLLVVLASFTLDSEIGTSFLKPQIEENLSGDVEIQETVMTNSETFVAAEPVKSFTQGNLDRKGKCKTFVTREDSLFDRIFVHEYNPKFSKIFIYRYSDSDIQKLASYDVGKHTSIMDLEGYNDKILVAVKKRSVGCKDNTLKPRVVILDEKGDSDKILSLKNLSGTLQEIKTGKEDNFYVLSTKSVRKYSKTGEKIWKENLAPESSFKAKKMDIGEEGLHIGLRNTNGEYRFKFKKISLDRGNDWEIVENPDKIKEELVSLKVTEEGDIVYAASVGDEKSVWLKDLIVKKIEKETGNEIWRNKIDSENPSIENNARIFLRENEGPLVYSRIEEYIFKGHFGDFEAESEVKAGITEISTNGKALKTVKTKRKYTEPSKTFLINDNIYQAEDSHIHMIERVNIPFRPKVELGLPRTVPFVTPSPDRLNEE